MTTAKELFKELEELQMNVKGGELDGCLVYHEAVKELFLSALRQAQESVRPTSLPTHNMTYKGQGYTWNEFDLLQKKFWEGVE